MTVRLITQKGSVIKRHRDIVGKYIHGCIYFHRKYLGTIFSPSAALTVSKFLVAQTNSSIFNILKYDHCKNYITAYASAQFDSVHEPIVGYYLIIDLKTMQIVRWGYSDKLWHHKWLFVDNNYTGFNVHESIERSKTWLALPDVNMHKIGNPTYWEELLNKHNLPK